MQNHIVVGLILLISGNLFSALYDISIKWLPAETSAADFLLLRQLLSVVILTPLWLWMGSPSPQRLTVHVLRANIGVLGALCLVMGLMVLPLATVSSLFYSAPLMIMLLGYVFLKEKINPGQWLCATLGFIGILIILRPGEMSLAGLLVLFSGLIFAVNQLTLKKLSNAEHPIMPLMMYNLLGIPLALSISLVNGFSGFSWPMLWVAFASNAFLLLYHWLCVLAYRKAQASDIAIAEYTGLLFIVFFGWLWFGEWLDSLTWLGVGLVVLPSLLLPSITRLFKQRRLFEVTSG